MPNNVNVEEECMEEYRKLKRGNLTGLLGMFLTALYAVVILMQFTSSSMPLAYIVFMPHTLCVIVAAIFSIIGYYAIKPWALLTAGVLMAISGLLTPACVKMIIVQTILLILSYIRKVT